MSTADDGRGPGRGRRSRRPRTWLVVGGVAIVVVVGLAFGAWWAFLRSDPAPRATITKTTVVEGGALDGGYRVAADGDSFVGYRVQEQFAAALVESTATGRTPAVEGTMTVSGPTIRDVRVTADLSGLTSDRAQRDNRLRTLGLETDRFPQATFVLTEPIRLDAVPLAGQTVAADAVGDLTLHGVTRRVTVPVEGRWDGRRVQVVGRLPVVFADYDIDPPNIGGFVSTRDRGEMELHLFFTPTSG